MPPKPPARPRPAPEPEPEVEPEVDPANATIAEGSAPVDGNATMIMDSAPPPPVKKGGAQPKLSVTKGPKAGTEFAIGPGETSVGRQGDNTIVIPDISVSRKHIVVRREGLSCILVDQGSGNGTQLNGARVEAETELQDGDVIAMGDTEMTFLAARAAPKPAPKPAPAARPGPSAGRRPAPKAASVGRRPAAAPSLPDDSGELPFDPHARQKASRKRLVIIGGAALAFFVLLGAFKVRQNRIAADQERIRQEQELGAAQEELDKLYDAGKKATNARDFKRAFGSYQKALDYAKKVDIDDSTWQSRITDLQRRIDLSKKEVNNQDALEKAQELGEKGELANAVEKLKAIPEDSLCTDKVGEVLEELKKKVPDRLNAGRAALLTKDFNTARQAVTDVLAVDAANAEAQTLVKQIEAAGQPTVRAPTGIKPKPQAEDPTARILETFAAGKLDEAIGMASACGDPKCATLKGQLASFRDAYNARDQEGNTGKAVTLLKSIPGGQSTSYWQTLSAAGATTYVKEGLKAMTGENYAKAFAAFRQVITVDPNNEVAKRNLGIIRQKAKELSEQAYIDMQQDPEKARRELEQILQMTEPGDELNTKAKGRIKKLGGGGGD